MIFSRDKNLDLCISLRDCDYCAARSERERARCRFIDLMLIRRRNLIAAAPPRAAIQPSFIIARSIDLPACWYFDITPRATAQIIFPFSHFFFTFFFSSSFDSDTVKPVFFELDCTTIY